MATTKVDLFPEYVRQEIQEAEAEIRKDLSDVKMAVQKERKRVAEKLLKTFEELQILDNQ